MGFGKQQLAAMDASAPETRGSVEQRIVEHRLAAGRTALEAKLMRVNDEVARQTDGGSLRPFFLIPDPCWNGVFGRLLMQELALSPYDDWNVVLLPDDERTAFLLDAPIHPNGNIPAFLKTAEEFIAREQQRLADIDADNVEAAREACRRRVQGLAAYFAARLVDVWKKHTPARVH